MKPHKYFYPYKPKLPLRVNIEGVDYILDFWYNHNKVIAFIENKETVTFTLQEMFPSSSILLYLNKKDFVQKYGKKIYEYLLSLGIELNSSYITINNSFLKNKSLDIEYIRIPTHRDFYYKDKRSRAESSEYLRTKLKQPITYTIKNAVQLAEEYHKDQIYSNDILTTVYSKDGVQKLPVYYIEHLRLTSLALSDYKDIRLHVLAYLHDILEDTNIVYEQIESALNPFIAGCVYYLTDEPGKNRKERKYYTYKKLSKIKMTSEYKIALIVKIADRIANVRYAVSHKHWDKFLMYVKEQDVFRDSVYRKGLCDDLITELEMIFVKGKKAYEESKKK